MNKKYIQLFNSNRKLGKEKKKNLKSQKINPINIKN